MGGKMVPPDGIEPPFEDYKSTVMPLYYRGGIKNGGDYRTRTDHLYLAKVSLSLMS